MQGAPSKPPDPGWVERCRRLCGEAKRRLPNAAPVRALKSAWMKYRAWLLAVLLVLSSNLFASGIKDCIDRGRTARSETEWAGLFLPVLVYGAVFFTAVVCLYTLRRHFFYPRTRALHTEKQDQLEQREYLVLFLSNLPESPSELRGALHPILELSGDLEKDLEQMAQRKRADSEARRWQWEMPLRGIWHHCKPPGKLKAIVLICSDKSVAQVHWFARILRELYAAHFKEIELHLLKKQRDSAVLIRCPDSPVQEGGWGFEDFDDLSRALLGLLRILDNQGVVDDQIMIDFTGGQKSTSVVAAAVSFNRRIKAQYVQTNAPWHVVGYDVELSTSFTEGMGW